MGNGMIRVCSGFSPAGRIQYGERFLRSFDRFWPAEIELRVYVEEPTPMPRGAERSLWAVPGALGFADRHRNDAAISGREQRPCWKQRERRMGYSFRTDAMKFFKQIMIPQAAALDIPFMDDGDILVWLDGDVETLRPVPPDLIPKLLSSGEIAFLGRGAKWAEIGFWAVRLNPATRRFLDDIAEQYRTDAFLELPQWHSAFIWDHVRLQAGLAERDLTPGGQGHVWPMSPLARYTRHDKGARKPA